MKKSIILITILSVVLCFSSINIFADEPTDQETRALMEKLKALEDEVKDLKEEADVRKKLRVTKEELEQKEEEILTAVDKEEYTLTKSKKINLTYKINYSYSSYDSFELDESDIFSEHLYNHSMDHTISISYGLLNNVSISYSLPFRYRYYKTGEDDSKQVSDIGDMSLGVGFRPFRTGGWMPTLSFHASTTLPTGRSPYKIDPEEELATGNGVYSLGMGMSMSKSIDPVVAFGGISYSYCFPKSGLTRKVSGLVLEKVEPGPSIGLDMGLGYAMSYRTSINLSFEYTYSFSSKYHYRGGLDRSTGRGASAGFSVGTGWKISPSTTIGLGVGIGLVGGENFSVSLSIPFTF